MLSVIQLRANNRKLREENERLRAEIDKLRQFSSDAVTEVKGLRLEVERLRKEVEDVVNAFDTERKLRLPEWPKSVLDDRTS